ncbi:Hypothetical protein FKW44_006385, partial [Caligus rogercresseyi]
DSWKEGLEPKYIIAVTNGTRWPIGTNKGSRGVGGESAPSGLSAPRKFAIITH